MANWTLYGDVSGFGEIPVEGNLLKRIEWPDYYEPWFTVISVSGSGDERTLTCSLTAGNGNDAIADQNYAVEGEDRGIYLLSDAVEESSGGPVALEGSISNQTTLTAVITISHGMTWPAARPGIDADKVWDEETEAWITNDARGGGRYKQQLVAVSDQGKIYFGGM